MTRRRVLWATIAVVVFGAAFGPARVIAACFAGELQDVAALKAAFVYNFAKFTEWPPLPAGAPIAVCVVGDTAIATALLETIHGGEISGHALQVSLPQDSTTWRVCHLLFIAESEARRSAAGLAALKKLPVLTVSDSKGFIQSGGIIELYLEGGKMRFAINVDTAEAAGLRLSSRLLGLAKIVKAGSVE